MTQQNILTVWNLIVDGDFNDSGIIVPKTKDDDDSASTNFLGVSNVNGPLQNVQNVQGKLVQHVGDGLVSVDTKLTFSTPSNQEGENLDSRTTTQVWLSVPPSLGVTNNVFGDDVILDKKVSDVSVDATPVG
jgi:hypothetical protein